MGLYVVVLVCLVIVLEILIAFILYPRRRGMNYYRLKTGTRIMVYRFDPDVGFSNRPYLNYSNPTPPHPNAPRKVLFVDVRTDKHGFHFTEDLDQLKETHKLIFCIGGSTTAGGESHINKTYPAVLDSFVKAHGYRCVNAGVGGFRSIHELLFFKKKILPFNPSAVIIFSGYNDFEDFAYDYYRPYDQFRHAHGHALPSSRLEEALDYSAFFHVAKRLVYKFLGMIRTESTNASRRERLRKALEAQTWLDEWRNNIGKIIEVSRERHITCYLLSHLSPTYENAPKQAKEFADKDLNMHARFDIFASYIRLIHKVTMDLAQEKGVRFIDIRSDFDRHCSSVNGQIDYKKRFSFFVDRCHFSEEGNFLFAKLIYAKIKEDL